MIVSKCISNNKTKSFELILNLEKLDQISSKLVNEFVNLLWIFCALKLITVSDPQLSVPWGIQNT